MKNFQLIFIVVFIASAIFGIFVFSGAIPIGNDGGDGSLGTVVLWGTVKSGTIAPILEAFNNAHPTFTVVYVEKNADNFDEELLEALATGTGPDLIFLPDNLVSKYENKIVTVPYQSYPLSAFKSNFAGAGEVFLTSKGVLAFPLTINPLMMYYSRSMLDANSIVFPPAYWDEFEKIVPTLTKKDESNKITKSAVALGDFQNIAHAKDIIATMFMQAGNPIVSEKEGFFSADLNSPSASVNLGSVLEFYAGFADPNSSVYSWNKSFPNSSEAFSREDLAFYFGFASELPTLINRNPNQNFLVSSFPQLRGSNFKLTGAEVLGVAVVASSKNFNTALTAAGLLATEDFALTLSEALSVVPARRNLLASKPTDAYYSTFYDSALFSRSWRDPADKETDDIFRRMIDSVLTNNLSVRDALNEATNRLNLLLIK